jgi:hypothetical protein
MKSFTPEKNVQKYAETRHVPKEEGVRTGVYRPLFSEVVCETSLPVLLRLDKVPFLVLIVAHHRREPIITSL